MAFHVRKFVIIFDTFYSFKNTLLENVKLSSLACSIHHV